MQMVAEVKMAIVGTAFVAALALTLVAVTSAQANWTLHYCEEIVPELLTRCYAEDAFCDIYTEYGIWCYGYDSGW